MHSNSFTQNASETAPLNHNPPMPRSPWLKLGDSVQCNSFTQNGSETAPLNHNPTMPWNPWLILGTPPSCDQSWCCVRRGPHLEPSWCGDCVHSTTAFTRLGVGVCDWPREASLSLKFGPYPLWGRGGGRFCHTQKGQLWPPISPQPERATPWHAHSQRPGRPGYTVHVLGGA